MTPLQQCVVTALLILSSTLSHAATQLEIQPSSQSTPSLESQAEYQVLLEQQYQQGLSAFMLGDYARAQQLWIEAARGNHGPSMFNLGLLHEQGKADQANLEKAYNWYRLAGRNGYAAANFHLASRLLEQQPNDSEGLELLNLAADQGYKPASQRLRRVSSVQVDVAQQPQTRATQTNTTQRTQSDSSVGNDSVRKVKDQALQRASDVKADSYRQGAWIKTQKSDAWTIQLLAFTEVSNVRAFMQKHQLQDRAAYYLDTSTTPNLYKLIMGVYTDKQEARSHLQSLPPELSENGPWLRSIASIQAVL